MAESTSDSDPRETNGSTSEAHSASVGIVATPAASTTSKDSPAAASMGSVPKKTPVKCQACTSCRQKKIRCDGGKPICAACLRSGADCVAGGTIGSSEIPAAVATGSKPHTAHAAPSAAVQAGQGTMPPPQPTTPLRGTSHAAPLPPMLPPAQSFTQYKQQQHGSIHQRLQGQPPQQKQQQNIAPIGSILAAALFPGSPHSTSEDDAGHSGHRSSGSESPLPHHVRPPTILVPAGDRGGHQTMAQATPLVIPRPSQTLATPSAGAGGGVGGSFVDPNIVEFFHYFNALFPIVHWPSFKEAYDDGTVPNYLILAIRALSKRYSKQPSVVLSGQLYAAGQDLAAIATSLAEVATREDPNTYLIQTWIILSMFEFGMGRMKQAADRRELAVRLAYQLELSHIEVRASQRRARSLIVAENCRRVWWTLFYADRYFSLVSSDPGISPAIHESTYRVGFPRAMREATPPPQLAPAAGASGGATDIEFPRYDDHDVILWFQSSIPLSLIMGHLAHQCRAAEQLFRNGLAERSTAHLWEDAEWLAALNEFVKSFLVIDAEIAQWRQQLNAATSMSSSPIDSPEVAHGENTAVSNSDHSHAHSTRDVTLFHRELQYHGLVIIHQCLALYSYEKLRLSLSTLASACTSLLWLESTATQAWKKVVRSADVIRSKANARATELANARASATGTMPNGAAPEPEWELCAPHMPFILYIAAKVHVCQYHWQKIALARTRSQIHHHTQQQQQAVVSPRHVQNIEQQVTPSFVQPFSQPSSAVGTPASSQEGWASSSAVHIGISGGSGPRDYAGNAVSAPDDLMRSHDAGGTPVMTTSGAAALAAAQAAAAAAAHSGTSKHSTPQRSRGGSTTHLHTLGSQDHQSYSVDSSVGKTGFGNDVDDDYSEMMDVTPTSAHAERTLKTNGNSFNHHSIEDDKSYSEFQMNVNDAEERMALVDGDIEERLVRRVASSEERLELLLRLLSTCQEYWADHDYVQMLHDMLRWPDEWTTSMQMLERLLLELRLD
ncbi:fungal-specific transcription factor domain-containing protein [Coemansia spiralis]|nr:fungal-specific transcription factor domain-containing protein [Coemansia spiralis]